MLFYSSLRVEDFCKDNLKNPAGGRCFEFATRIQISVVIVSASEARMYLWLQTIGN